MMANDGFYGYCGCSNIGAFPCQHIAKETPEVTAPCYEYLSPEIEHPLKIWILDQQLSRSNIPCAELLSTTKSPGVLFYLAILDNGNYRAKNHK